MPASRPLAASPAGPVSRVGAVVREFTTGFLQFWEGYWSGPPGC